MLLLVPSDVLRPRRVDDHFVAEADAARAAGHQVALVDHDALTQGAADRAVARVPADTAAIYRGWMLDGGRYGQFAAALAGRGTRLRTDADAARQRLGAGPGVLRDYTKSMKHYWHEAAYIPDLTDGPAAWRIAERLRELRGEDLAGGFVLRRFEPFTGAEVRTWWINGVCRLITAHPDTPNQPPDADAPAVPGLAAAVAGLGLPFVTVDLARRDDGTWRVIELGDGQVSDRPNTTPAESLIAALLPDETIPSA